MLGSRGAAGNVPDGAREFREGLRDLDEVVVRSGFINFDYFARMGSIRLEAGGRGCKYLRREA